MSNNLVSHAFVVPDENFNDWLQALRPYLQKFERVVVVRSPRGNDLNRYRNVTAVAAPLTWFQDDPLAHIRRIYPSVVRVDVIRATTPKQLEPILQARIQANDRYGEKQNNPVHLYDRFILEWPTTHRPLKVVRKFAPATDLVHANEGLSIATRPGADVIASVAGRVTRQWQASRPDVLDLGNYVQVTTTLSGQTTIVTYAGLSKIHVPLHSDVAVGQKIGEAAGENIKLIVQQPPGGLSGFRLPNIVDPTSFIYVQDMRVRPTGAGLRVRSVPSMNGEIIGYINPWDVVECLEQHGRALIKTGVEGQWLRVRLADGRDGHCAAWYLEAIIRGEGALAGVNPVGVNLDALHPLGTPPANQLGGLGWVRIGYNVSANRGSEDIRVAYDRYAPLAERYQKAGYRVMFVTSHQTYGEGKDHFWPWPSMNDDKWRQLIDPFADMMYRISQQYAGKNLVDCWQVWNEQDAPIGAGSSVPMRPHNYTLMLTKVIRAIRAGDNRVTVITGGHTGGPDRGASFARESISNMPSDVRPDGVAFHPYGRGTQPGPPYSIFGHIDESMQAYVRILPEKPVWITEWGVLDRPNDSPSDIADYALSLINFLKTRYPGRVAALIWYAWAQSMHNGYGLVDTQGRPRPPLTERFLRA